jgi:hypothetical protein
MLIKSNILNRIPVDVVNYIISFVQVDYMRPITDFINHNIDLDKVKKDYRIPLYKKVYIHSLSIDLMFQIHWTSLCAYRHFAKIKKIKNKNFPKHLLLKGRVPRYETLMLFYYNFFRIATDNNKYNKDENIKYIYETIIPRSYLKGNYERNIQPLDIHNLHYITEWKRILYQHIIDNSPSLLDKEEKHYKKIMSGL